MSTKPKKFCFVLMPFGEDFKDTYELGIKAACTEAGAYCERVDEQIFKESIVDRIYNQISKADIVRADMSGRNPNVFYEVGYAHALGKTTILLTKDVDDIPFDLKHYPHIVYENRIMKLKEQLVQKVKWFIENANNTELDYKIDFDFFLDDKSLSRRGVQLYSNDSSPEVKINLFNGSFMNFDITDYRIGIITDSNYFAMKEGRSCQTIKLPDGNNMHYIRRLDALYPSSYAALSFTLIAKIFRSDIWGEGNDERYSGSQEIIIRLFTSRGTRDFYLMLHNKGVKASVPDVLKSIPNQE